MSHVNRRGHASGFYAHRNGVAQALNAGAWNTAEFTTKTYDGLNEFANTTTYYFTSKHIGIYLIEFMVTVSGIADGQFFDLGLEIDASGTHAYLSGGKSYIGSGGSCTRQLIVLARLVAGTQLRPRIYVGAGVPIMTGADGASHLSVQRLR